MCGLWVQLLMIDCHTYHRPAHYLLVFPISVVVPNEKSRDRRKQKPKVSLPVSQQRENKTLCAVAAVWLRIEHCTTALLRNRWFADTKFNTNYLKNNQRFLVQFI